MNDPDVGRYKGMSKVQDIWRNPWIGWLSRLAFSALLLTVVFSQIDFVSVMDTLNLTNVRLLGPIVVLFFLIRLIASYQMSLGLVPLGMRFTVPHLLKINLISSLYSLVLPGNLVAGGAALWYKLSRPAGQRIEALGLLIYFRLVNTLTLVGIGLVGVWFDPLLRLPGVRAVVLAMFAGVVLLLLPFFSPAVGSRIEGVGRHLSRRGLLPRWIQDKGQTIWKLLTSFQEVRKRTIVLVLALSLLSHVLGILYLYLLAVAVDIHLSMFVVAWIRTLLGIIHMIPISIAGLGVREISLVVLLRNYGISGAQALTLSLALFSMTIVGGIVGGLLEGWDIFVRGRRKASHAVVDRGADTAGPG